MVKNGLTPDILIDTALLNMYVKCRCLESSKLVFDRMAEKNVVTWTGLMMGYTQADRQEETLALFARMIKEVIELDEFVFSVVLKACSKLGDLGTGRQIHGYIVKLGMDSGVSVGTPLVDFYAKFGSLEEARQAFNRISDPNDASWSALISGWLQIGKFEEALEVFKYLRDNGRIMNRFMYTSIFHACSALADLSSGTQVHGDAIKKGLVSASHCSKCCAALILIHLSLIVGVGQLQWMDGWPFIHKFSEMSLQKREVVLQNWSKARFLVPHRGVFMLTKAFCFFTFFSRTDEKSENPAWDAMGYHLETDENSHTIHRERPIEKGIVETMYETDSTLITSLKKKGFKVTKDPQQNLYNVECDVVIVGSGCGGGVAAGVLASAGQKEWAVDHKLPLYGSSDCVSAMDTVFSRLGVTENCTKEGLQNQILRRGCKNLGLKVESVVRNSSDEHYCGSCNYGCKTGDKKGAQAFRRQLVLNNIARIQYY
ncbi:pentatricopeptide repeat-containing protein At1g71420-like [Macadamia integrifolia]|uniref:pentatricopeptide repeat-containing protein At1g71420-like n=1 Tax=Macadamia integrifolia TaxID=60698 RepID=UPI001C5337A7|nr:pentatricopeptide repeat-containing protein At1g71420-like [Macadamia integrifolia]